MKISSVRRAVVVRVACPVCHEPARARPPHMWLPANGPRPSWSHVDGEPLCPVVGADGYRPARRGCVLTALRPARAHRTGRRSYAIRTGRAVTRRTVRRPVSRPVPDGAVVFMVAGGDMVAVFDNPWAARVMAMTMTGANLEPVTVRLSPARWAKTLAELRAHVPHIAITDARSGRPAGTP